MTPETLEALQSSIAKWERNAVAEKPGDYLTTPRDCPLCNLFYYDSDCSGCPVREKTGKNACSGTPYNNATSAHYDWKLGNGTQANAHGAARDEVAFLKSLLPVQP